MFSRRWIYGDGDNMCGCVEQERQIIYLTLPLTHLKQNFSISPMPSKVPRLGRYAWQLLEKTRPRSLTNGTLIYVLIFSHIDCKAHFLIRPLSRTP